MVALEEVGGDHLAFQAGDGRQRPSRAGSGVARGVDRRIGGALQELVDFDTPPARPDVGLVKVEAVDRRDPPGAVHDEIGFEGLAPTVDRGVHPQAVRGLLDRLDRGVRMKGHADVPRPLDQRRDQVRIERRERPLAPFEDHDPGIGARGDVRELERDVAAADQQHALRQAVEVEELIAGHDVLGAGQGKRHWPRPGRDHDVARAQALIADRDRGRVDEACGALERGDAGLGEGLLAIGRHRVGEAALERHQTRPVDREAGIVDPPGAHQPRGVDDFGAAAEHFLRVAAAQGAGAAERQLIHDGDRPAGRTASGGHSGCRHARADHDQVDISIHQAAPGVSQWQGRSASALRLRSQPAKHNQKGLAIRDAPARAA
jgi:hypothetical protein